MIRHELFHIADEHLKGDKNWEKSYGLWKEPRANSYAAFGWFNPNERD